MAPQSNFFALFCTSKVSVDRINEILAKSEEGACSAHNSGWHYWLATQNFPDGNMRDYITKVPVTTTPLDFIDKDFQTLSTMLKQAGEKVDLNRNWFAVLDERTDNDGSMLLCKADNDKTVDSLRTLPEQSSLTLSGLSIMRMTWDELETALNRKKKDGKGDVLD